MFFNVKKIVFSVCIFFVSFQIFSQAGKPDALRLYNEGHFKEAIAVCEGELEANPRNIESYVVLCWSLIKNKQYWECEQKATAARKINSYDVRLIEVLGEAKFYLQKYDESMAMFQRYIANAGENGSRVGEVYYFMGEIYILQGKFQHADISFSAAVRNSPQRAYWWSRLGYAKEKTSDWKNAVIAYDQALKIDATQYDAVTGRKRCLPHLQ